MRAAISIVTLAFGLSACAPEGDGGKSAPSPMPGYELASAKSVAGTSPEAVIDLSVDELTAMQAAGNIRLIDIRRDDEVALGMISGAEHMPMESFDVAAIDQTDGRKIVLYCRSGRRSGILGGKLAAHTGEAATHLAGGIIAWRKAGEEIAIPD